MGRRYLPELLLAAVFVLFVLFVGLWWLYDVVSGWLANLWNGLTGETRRTEQRIREERAARLAAENKEREEEAAERAEIEREHKHTLDNVRDLISSCGKQFKEAILGAAALTGASLDISTEKTVLNDVSQLFMWLRLANDEVPLGLWRLLYSVRLIVEPESESSMEDSFRTLAIGSVDSGVKLPTMVVVLNVYDQQARTHFASKVAAAYRSIALAAADLCNSRIAVQMVVDEYLKVLKPHILDGDAGSGSTSSGRRAWKAKCGTCVNAYRLLGLPYGASDEEVKSKKRGFAELLHDDRLRTMSDNARRIALEQHKSVNDACDHILLRCTVRAKLDDDINGSESPPAPHQSTSATTPGEKIKHQPSPASSSDASDVEKQEPRHKVRSEQELIDVIDATRKKVDATTKEISDFLEQMKKRKQTSLERL